MENNPGKRLQSFNNTYKRHRSSKKLALDSKMNTQQLLWAARVLHNPELYTADQLRLAVNIECDAEQNIRPRVYYTKKLRGIPDRAKKVHI